MLPIIFATVITGVDIPTPSTKPSTTPTAAPSPYSITTCTNGCVILSGAETIAIGKRLALVTLPQYFKVSFEISRLTVPSTDTYFNVFALADTTTGASLLAVYVKDTLNLGIVYNGTTITTLGPLIQSDYVTVFTTITLEVSTTTVKVYTSATGEETAYPIPAASTVTPGDRVYALYTSVPGITSTTGTVRTLTITSKTIFAHCYNMFFLIRARFMSTLMELWK